MNEIDKELISMCDTPEIQDRWEPKVGDRTGSDMPKYSPATVIGIDAEGHVKIEPDVAIGRVFGFAQNEVIYIPRIEDVQDMFPQKYTWVTIFNIALDYSNGCDIVIKALFKAYMHLEHNKTWNGEEWA